MRCKYHCQVFKNSERNKKINEMRVFGIVLLARYRTGACVTRLTVCHYFLGVLNKLREEDSDFFQLFSNECLRLGGGG